MLCARAEIRTASEHDFANSDYLSLLLRVCV